MSKTVEEIGKIVFRGNIIPVRWFEHIKFDSGKPDSLGVLLLADIIYWYRPVEVRDENTGQVVEYRKKFKEDKLQKTYEQLAAQFGFSKRQTKDALKRLERKGLITLELRNLKTDSGLFLSNVLFIEPVTEAIKKITHPETPINKGQRKGYDVSPLPRGGMSEGGGGTTDVDTYTKTTTKTTTKISPSVVAKPEVTEPIDGQTENLAEKIKETGATKKQLARAWQRLEEQKEAGTVIRHEEKYFLATLENEIEKDKLRKPEGKSPTLDEIFLDCSASTSDKASSYISQARDRLMGKASSGGQTLTSPDAGDRNTCLRATHRQAEKHREQQDGNYR